MVDSILFDKAVDAMHKALNISSERNTLITSNIANVDTIGYTPRDLDFKKTLMKALEAPDQSTLARTNAKHFAHGASPDVSGQTVYKEGSAAAVDIDQEMADLAENNIQYRASSEMLMRKLNMIRFSITEGGK